MRAAWIIPTFLVVLAVAFCPLTAHAMSSNAGVFNDVSNRFKDAVDPWGRAFSHAGITLFWGLVPIAMVWNFSQKAMQGGGLSDILAEFVRFTLFIGFYFWLCQNGLQIAKSIIDSMEQIAGQAAGKSVLSPSAIMNIGFLTLEKIFRAFSALSWKQVPEGIVMLISGIVFIMIVTLVAINMLLAITTSWILMYAGIFILGFGATSWTSEMAIGYFRGVLSAGLRIVGMILVVSVSSSVLEKYTQNVDLLNFLDIATLMVVAVVMYLLSERLPEQLAALPSGSIGQNANLTGSGAWGSTAASAAIVMQGIKMAAATTSGVGGIGMAVNAALEAAEKNISEESGMGNKNEGNSASSLSEAMGDSGGNDFDGDAIAGNHHDADKEDAHDSKRELGGESSSSEQFSEPQIKTEESSIVSQAPHLNSQNSREDSLSPEEIKEIDEITRNAFPH